MTGIITLVIVRNQFAPALRRSQVADRKVAIVLYGFPPNAGAAGTAAYLGVFESLFNTLNAMKAEGYDLTPPDSVDALREHVRQTLAKGPPRLAQLAALDAVLGEMLGGREQRLLNNVPAFLKLRFTELRRQPLTAENNWLATFNTELEQTLLAELDHRLQPVAGMIESISHEP